MISSEDKQDEIDALLLLQRDSNGDLGSREVQLGCSEPHRWRHLVAVAAMSVVVHCTICVALIASFSAHMQHDCRETARQEVDKLLRKQPMSFVSGDVPSAYVESSAAAQHSRARRQSNGRRPTTQPQSRQNGTTRRQNGNGHTRQQLTDAPAIGIHLEFKTTKLEQAVIERLHRINGSSEGVEFGQIFSNNRFKPAADRYNGTTRYSFRNWTPSQWFNQSSLSATVFQYDYQRGMVRVQRPGLYYIYSQMRFYHKRHCSYAVMINDDRILFKCLEGTDGQAALWQFSSCYLGGVTALNSGDRIWLRDMYGQNSNLFEYYVYLDPPVGAASYWGIVRLGHL